MLFTCNKYIKDVFYPSTLSLALYSVSSQFAVVGEKLCLSTFKRINNLGFEVTLPRYYHGYKFQKIWLYGKLKFVFPDIFLPVR